jgi:hypothetical protein
VQKLLLQCVPFPYSSSSHVLRRCPQQRFPLDGFVVVKVRPEEVLPVTSVRFKCTEEVALEEVDAVVPDASVEWTFTSFRNEVTISETNKRSVSNNDCNDVKRHFSPVPIHPLIGRHTQANNLIFLTHKQYRHPHEVERGVQHDPSDPRRAAINDLKRSPKSFLVVDIAHFRVESSSAVKHPTAHDDKHHEKPDEVFVVFSADAISDLGS